MNWQQHLKLSDFYRARHNALALRGNQFRIETAWYWQRAQYHFEKARALAARDGEG